MSAVSKYWHQIATPDVTCQMTIHPGLSCYENIRTQIRTTVGGNLSFFVPVSVLRLLLLIYSRRTVSIEIVRQTLFELFCCTANGWAVSNSWSAGFCARYWWHGRMTGTSFIYGSAIAGTLLMYWMPQYVKSTHSRAIFNVFLECWIKSRDRPWVEFLRESKAAGTLAFMIVSAAIGFAALRIKGAEFWFFAPVRKNYNPESDRVTKACFHRDSCVEHIKDGLRTSFTFGMILEVARRLIGSAPKAGRDPWVLVTDLRKIRFKFVAFLALYNGLFRYISCYLAKRRGKMSPHDSTIAGFLSGVSYWLSPNYNVFNLGVTVMLQNMWRFIVEHHGQRNKMVQQLDRLPFSFIAWVLLMNYNMYARACYPYAMSRYALKFTDLCSASQSQVASECFAKLLFEPR
ncbi:uncharacterized protein LOC129739588 [Uranotaenia lowii]|uniref:uncharacterized protein LOC129739588 n=1 Tax=Uranotaenia lowii TaxID=190385 RepID=UPI00247B1702|nr:uncharacterized protein LOC129739588 [Uranotaenia lowii]